MCERNIIYAWLLLFGSIVIQSVAEQRDNDGCISTRAASEPVDNNIQFNLPDLTVVVEDGEEKSYKVKGYKLNINDRILEKGSNKTETEWAQLRWVSLGHPVLKKTPNNGENKHHFYFTSRGFHTYIETLTDDHRVRLAAMATKQYGPPDVLPEQIIFLPLVTFACKLEFSDTEENDYTIIGTVKNLNTFPLRLEFDVPRINMDVVKLEQLLDDSIKAESLPEVTINCTVRGTGKSSSTSLLTITAEQIEKINLADNIFGDADESYVSRHQASEIAAEVYTSLNVYEEYDVGAKDFEKNFVADLIQQVSDASFQPVSLDQAVKDMSKFAVDFKGDLEPSVVKHEMSSMFKLEKKSGKEHIILNKDEYESLKTRNKVTVDSKGSANYGPWSVDASVSVAKENQKAEEHASKDHHDELHEMNSMSKEHVQWERDGEKIVPKSMNVVKMQKASFKKKLTFKRIKRVMYEAAFRDNFILYSTYVKEPSQVTAGVTYTRWGSRDCPSRARQLYNGTMAGGHADAMAGHTSYRGSVGDYVCLHPDPKWAFPNGSEIDAHTERDNTGQLHTVSYKLAYPLPQDLSNNVAPCAVCFLPFRVSTTVLYGRTECPADWRLEYSGWLVSGGQSNDRTSYTCLERHPDARHSSAIAGQLRTTELRCGALHCKTYKNGYEVACVVCSK